MERINKLKLLILQIILDEDSDNNNADYYKKNNKKRRRELIRVEPQKKIIKIWTFIETVNMYDDKTFQKHFRVSREIFEMVINDLKPFEKLGKRRPSIPTKDALLMTIWTLSTQESYREISDRFGVSIGTAFSTVLSMCKMITSLKEKYIRWPQSIDELQEVAQQFNILRGENSFPNVIGCVDGTHIPIPAPVVDPASYYNRKGFHSLLLQGVCDSKLVFRNVFFGWPGSAHDACIWENSTLGKQLESGKLTLPNLFHLLGDCAYPVRKYLMTPYRDNGYLSRSKINFNIKLSSSRIVVEQAFGLLKGRFRKLKYLNVGKLENAKYFVLSAIILHNLLLQESQSGAFEILDDEDLDITNENRDSYEIFSQNLDSSIAARRDAGKVKRDRLMGILEG